MLPWLSSNKITPPNAQPITCRAPVVVHMAKCIVLCLGMLSMAPQTAHADDSSWLDTIQFHGFLTQGYVNTTDNNWFGDSEDGSLDFTELGINTSLRLTPTITLAAQALSRRAGDMDDGSPRLDYGSVSYQAYTSSNAEFGFRAGRIKNKIGLYNDTRDVAATRPGVFMPQSIYFDRIRDLVISSDGLGAFGALHFPAGSFYLNVNVGELLTDKNVKATFIGEDLPASISSDNTNVISNLLYEYDGGRIRVALTNVDYTLQVKADPGSPISNGSIDGDYRILSGEYNTEFWSLAAEYSRQPLAYNGISPRFDPLDGEAEAYYIQALRRLPNDWSTWLRYEASFRDKDDRNGRKRAPTTRFLGHTSFTKSWVAGVRWDISTNLMVSAEYQRNDGTFILSRVENPSLNQASPKWDIFSMLVSYRF